MQNPLLLNRLKPVALGLAIFTGLVLLYGVPTALIPTPWFVRMVAARPLDYVFLFLNSGLLATYFGLQFSPKQQPRKRSEALATGGALANIFVVGCPICNVLLVSLFGSSAILTYFEPYRGLVGFATAGLLGTAVFMKMKHRSFCWKGTTRRNV